MTRAFWIVVLSGLVSPAVSSTASAQPAPRAATEKWEISGHFGGLLSTNPTAGTFVAPPLGSVPLATGASGRRVSSWFFGDGGALLNDVNALSGKSARVTSLDGLLSAPMIDYGRRLDFGFRVARVLTPRFTAEVAVDYSPGGARAISDAAGSLRVTRESFVTAMRQLLTVDGVFPRPFTSASSMGSGTGGQLLTTGSLKVRLTSIGAVTPFVTGGAGIATRSGQLPGGSIESAYGMFYGFPPCLCSIVERDEVRLRVTASSRDVVGVVGAGLDYQPSVTFWRGRAENHSRWGIRLDVRVFVGGSDTETFVDSRPSVTTGDADMGDPADFPTAGVLVVGALPAVQFSNDPVITGFESSLSGPLTDFRVFSGSGIRTHIAFSTGLFVRF